MLRRVVMSPVASSRYLQTLATSAWACPHAVPSAETVHPKMRQL
jgi:hypothetical protein